MKRIPESTVHKVIDSADIVRVVGDFLRLERKGNRFWGLCPFHGEKTPSFSVDPDKNFFYCFGCHKGGNPVTFLMEAEKLNYVEALEYLAKQAGIIIDYEQSEALDAEEKFKQDLLELYKRVAGTFSYLLKSHKDAEEGLNYLKSRHVSEEMITQFSLGWSIQSRSWLYQFLIKKGYSKDFLAKSGLFSQKYPDSAFFQGRIMFPIKSIKGDIIAFGGRTLGDGPKYLNSSDSIIYHKGETLFALFEALPAIKKSQSVILCEGYMDVIALHQAGFNNAIAPLGTAFTAQQAEILKRWVKTAYLLFDSDEAGQTATKKAILICNAQGIESKVFLLEHGKDPSEVLQNDGPEALKKMLESSLNDVDYLVKRARSLYNFDKIEGKSQAAEWLFPLIDSFSGEIKKQAGIDQIAQELGIDRAAVLRDFQRRPLQKNSSGMNKPVEQKQKVLESIILDRELFFLCAVAVHRDLFTRVRSCINAEDLENPSARAVYIALEESFRNEDSDFETFLNRISSKELKEMIAEKSVKGEFQTNPDKIIDDGVRSVQIKTLEKKRDKILASMKNASKLNTDDVHTLDELIYEKMYVDKELSKLKGDKE